MWMLSHRVVVLNEGEVIAEGNPMKRCASSAWSTSVPHPVSWTLSKPQL
jgi:hypothetical protein